jgi:hypothetical protein
LAQILGQPCEFYLICRPQPSGGLRLWELVDFSALDEAAAELEDRCVVAHPSHYPHQIYTKSTPKLLVIPLILNKVA